MSEVIASMGQKLSGDISELMSHESESIDYISVQKNQQLKSNCYSSISVEFTASKSDVQQIMVPPPIEAMIDKQA